MQALVLSRDLHLLCLQLGFRELDVAPTCLRLANCMVYIVVVVVLMPWEGMSDTQKLFNEILLHDGKEFPLQLLLQTVTANAFFTD